jgi:hypothetical protein
VVYWDSFCQLMTANTTQATVSTASTIAENRTMESFRIRRFPNLSTPCVKLEAVGAALDWSNWDAIWFSGCDDKTCIYLNLQNYKYLRAEKLLKLVFPCDFLYFHFWEKLD